MVLGLPSSNSAILDHKVSKILGLLVWSQGGVVSSAGASGTGHGGRVTETQVIVIAWTYRHRTDDVVSQ